jgi:ABC-type glycerol-3-phosphate transport system substrate-binding protein
LSLTTSSTWHSLLITAVHHVNRCIGRRVELSTGYLPVRQSAKADVLNAYKNDPKWGPVADAYAKMFDWAQYSKIESPVAGYDPVRDVIDKQVMTRVMTDSEADPKKLLDDAVSQANQILAENAPKR